MKNFITQHKVLIIYILGLAIIGFCFIFLVSVNIIGHDVKTYCKIAQGKYEGECVQALTSYVDDEENDFASRNSAIWALGQLGDDQALAVLKKYHTGKDDDKGCNRREELSQLEIKRAIGYIEGNNFNATTFFWRFGEDID